jgi:hypothetical protein
MPKTSAQIKIPQAVKPTGFLFEILAERTGLEPATPGVTGRYSNQLNYRSNRYASMNPELVGAERLELPTYAL